ncbi:MAG TPA: hypothetical protein VGG10_07230 [Rhizomicrobium sp.]|jgi:tetratricopeptide (TPR) repeat protein
MSEDADNTERASGAPANSGAAWGALGAADRERSNAFLAEQTEVLRLQKERMLREDASLDEEQRLNLSHLRLRRFGDYMRSLLEIAVGLVVLLVVAGIGAMVWYATEDHDLVVEAFSVPPDMASSGMTGTALANRVLDRFGAMDRSVKSFFAGVSAYHGNNSDDVRVEIPNTGISIGELNRYLRGWLGHETHVTGELVRTPKGLALTVRYGGDPGQTAEGGDLDRLIQKSAETMFESAQPLRYTNYLSEHGRTAEAKLIAEREEHAGSDSHRAEAYVASGLTDYYLGDNQAQERDGRAAVRLDPNGAGWFILQAAANNLSHEEESWHAGVLFARVLAAGRVDTGGGEWARGFPLAIAAGKAQLEGNALGAIRICDVSQRPVGACVPANRMSNAIGVYDFDLARQAEAEAPATRGDGGPNVDLLFNEVEQALALGDWPGAVARSEKAEAATGNQPHFIADRDIFLRPYEAEALARNGGIAAARAMVAAMPPDCDLCMRARGRVETVAHDWPAAAHWFALVSQRSPHIPFADTDWGRMLLTKGDLDGAIAKFAQAHREGPHFADPLEMWGEALMLKNRSDLAPAKFAEAAKNAPNWARLHLKWGEALFYAGKKDEAKKQLAIAASLVLSDAGKAELARMKKQMSSRP